MNDLEAAEILQAMYETGTCAGDIDGAYIHAAQALRERAAAEPVGYALMASDGKLHSFAGVASKFAHEDTARRLKQTVVLLYTAPQSSTSAAATSYTAQED